MASLRIAYIVPAFPTLTETFIINQIVDMLQRGHEVKIFAFAESDIQAAHQVIERYGLREKTIYAKHPLISKADRLKKFFRYVFSNRKQIDFLRLPQLFNFFRLGKNGFNLSYFTRHLWILEAGNFDVIHAHFGNSGAYIAELKFFGFFKRIPLVTTFHGYDLHPSSLQEHRVGYKKLFREANLFTVNTPYLEEVLHKLKPKARIEVLPVGLDTTKFQPLEKESSDNFQILFVGRLVKFKAPDLAMEVVKKLRKKGYSIKMTFVGAGELLEDLKILAQKLKLIDICNFKGSLTQEKVKEEMQRADVFLLPGIYDQTGRAETQGLVIQEAQAMQLPVVVSDAGGMKYGVINGQTGFVVKEKDVSVFAEKIELLINNPQLRQQMGKKGRAFVSKNYDSRILGDRLEKIYLSAINQ